MKLKKLDQTRFDMIKNMIENFLAMGQDLDFVLTGLKSQIEDFESEVGVKIKIDPNAEDKVTLIDLRKDFMRTRYSNPENLVFRAKSQGVPIEVKIFKAGEYEFSNKDVVEAMKALIQKVEALESEIKDMGHSDFKESVSEGDAADYPGSDDADDANDEQFDHDNEEEDDREDYELHDQPLES